MQPLRGGLAPLTLPTYIPVTSWWLAGGISAANCIAAYAPKGAASLAASYTNLANPGTYNAAPGVAPTWDATNGWTFNGNTHYLTTGIVPVSGYTMICRMEMGTAQANTIISAFEVGKRFYLSSNNALGRLYGYGNFLAVTPAISTDCVMAIAGGNAYLNGVSDGSTSGTLPATTQIIIGGTNIGNYTSGKIKAAAVYNTTLSAAQVLAVTNAMNAL